MDVISGLAVTDAAVQVMGKGGKAGRVPLVAPLTVAPATSLVLTGTASASKTDGPFSPDLGRPIWVTIAGAFTGSVTVLRSIDGGATRQGLTVVGQPWGVFTGPVNEAVAEETVAAATYYLSIVLTSGSLTYRVEQ